MWTQTVSVIKVTEDRKKKQQDQLVIEKESDLYLNDTFITHIVHTPQHEKELAVGYLSCHKLVDIVTGVKYEQEENKIVVTGSAAQETKQNRDSFQKIDTEVVFQLSAYFQEKAYLYKKTAITESAALASNKELLYHAEDINQENALYKVVGQSLLNNETKDLYLLLSAKVDSPLMQQLITLPINAIISRTAATKQAIDLAIENKISLYGFARGRRFNLYTQ